MSAIPGLCHYTADAAFRLDRSRQYLTRAGAFKPNGLWLSIDEHGDGWSDWCRANEFNSDGLIHSCGMMLRDDAHILHLKTGGDYRALNEVIGGGSSPTGIDWSAVVSCHDGIIFDNYCSVNPFPDSMPPFWFSVIDCSSACIWDLSAITSDGTDTQVS